MGSWILLAVVIAVALLWGLPQLFRWRRDRHRRELIRRLEQQRDSRVITLIHRQEGLGLFGLPFGRYIDIDDSEQLLRAIRLTPDDMAIDLLLHTPGGLVLASDQIAYALKRHGGRVTVIVPHYAMSGGTLVALAADEILMDPDAVLGPVDPQLGSLPRGSWPAASILKALEQDNPNRDDETLILGDVARKAIDQVRATVRELLEGRVEGADAERLAALLSEGRWTHDYPIRLEEARQLGLPVSDAVPELVYELMTLYPRRSQRRPSVEFIPTPYRTRGDDG
ncbi:MAG: SDH family Clp fold serine proteinase [Deltaproteobacteria bacterium]